jgi:large subunit ribosomal protein L14
MYFSTTQNLSEVQKMTRLHVVDNSGTGRIAELSGHPARCIQVYNKTGVGRLGDKVLVAIRGKKKKAFIVGCAQKQKFMVPKFDSNNIVLLEDSGMPTGTRIKVPIPSCLRGKEGDFTKILSIATKFV